MEDFSQIAKTSGLLDDDLRAQIRGVFEKLTEDIELVALVNTQEEKSRELLSLLFDIEALGARVHVRAYELGECPTCEADFNAQGRTPALGIYKNGTYTGISFFGVPGGKEMNSLILGCYNVAGAGQPVSKWTSKKLSKLKKAAHIQVFVSLACHHCAATVISAQHLAALSPHITAAMVDANLYPDLVKAYEITRVPMTVIQRETEEPLTLLGEKTMEELLQCL